MLPLKHLFDDRDLALAILSRWDYDPAELHLLAQFRISSNAIYPFRVQGKTQFLRFAPLRERSADAIWAELDFLRYLRRQGFPCLVPVVSKQGNELELVATAKGSYLATAFVKVPGKSLEPALMTDEMISGWGKTMGKLHRLSMSYQPAAHRRPDYQQQLHWVSDVLADFPDESLARQEVQIISDWLAALPQDKHSFGLIHYDFETDNVFYDQESNSFHVIDFDDAVYHWFMMDVTTALMSYADDAPAGRFDRAKELFIAGYRREHELSDDWVALMPGFRRYQNLYGYARIFYATQEPVPEQPEWMIKLQRHLDVLKRRRAVEFGQPIALD